MRSLKDIALTSVGLIGLLASGCSSFSSANYSNQITYPKYVAALSRDAEELAKKGDPDSLYESGKTFMKIGKIERTEVIVEELLKKNRIFALNLYDELQKFRNEHPEKK